MSEDALGIVVAVSVIITRKQDTDAFYTSESSRARLTVGAIATARRLRKFSTGRPDARDADVNARGNLYTTESIRALYTRRARLIAESTETNLIVITSFVNVTRFLNTGAIDTNKSIRAISIY